MGLGAFGQPNIAVGNTGVPPPAIANLLATLLNHAAAASNASRPTEQIGEDVPAYVRGRPGIDPFNTVERAAALYELFEATPVAGDAGEDDESIYGDPFEWDPGHVLYESAFEDD
jgi:hypothetical protein